MISNVKTIIFDLDDTLFDTSFYKKNSKEPLKLFSDTKTSLEELKSKFKLLLVTIGDPKTQETKVSKLGLKDFFEKIYFVDLPSEKTKEAAFKSILDSERSEAQTILSVGNRMDTDIKFAKSLGMKAILFEHGQYLHLTPESELLKPDATIKSLSELTKCLKP